MSDGLSREEILELIKSELSIGVSANQDYGSEHVYVTVSLNVGGETISDDSFSIKVER